MTWAITQSVVDAGCEHARVAGRVFSVKLEIGAAVRRRARLDAVCSASSSPLRRANRRDCSASDPTTARRGPRPHLYPKNSNCTT